MKSLQDKQIKQKLLHMQSAPPGDAWLNIENQLNKKERRRILPFWFKRAAVAASLLLLVGTGSYFLYNSKSTNQQPIAKENQNNQGQGNKNSNPNQQNHELTPQDNQTTTNQITKGVGSNKAYNNPNNARTQHSNNHSNTQQGVNSNGISKQNNSIQAFNQKSKTNQWVHDHSTNKNISHKTNQVTTKPLLNNHPIKKDNKPLVNNNPLANNQQQPTKQQQNSTNQPAATNPDQQNNQDEITDLASLFKEQDANNQDSEQQTKQKSPKRFDMIAYAAPMYYSSFAGNSPVAELQNYNTQNTLSNSYGIKAGYAITPRIKIRTGIAQVQLLQQSQNVPVVNATAASQETARQASANTQGNIKYQGVLRIGSNPNRIAKNSAELQSAQINNLSQVQQDIQYLEIPIEAEYNLLSKKIISLSATGGLSTYLLTNNQITAQNNGQNLLIGEANNLNNLSFSTNAGVRLDVRLTPSMQLSAEPQFRYLINTNSSTNYQPYILGVNAGLKFEF